MERLEKYGYVTIQVFNNKTLEKIHIDAYLEEPYTLFARVDEKNIKVKLDDKRVVLTKKDNTTLANVPLDNIMKCMVKKHSNSRYEFICVVHNIFCKLSVVV